VLADGLRRDLPTTNRMAPLAIGSHLSAVKVRVTIRAVLPHIGKDWFDVALRAGDILVQPAERIARRVVIEFGDCPDRTPACVGVTILTGNGKRTVRTPCSLLLRGCRRSKNHTQDEQQGPMPPHRHIQLAAPNFPGFVQPGRGAGKATGSRQNNCARIFPNNRFSPQHFPGFTEGSDIELSISLRLNARAMPRVGSASQSSMA
jgi:hypothetical protein